MESTSLTLLERVRQSEDVAAWDRFVDLYAGFLYHCARRAGVSEADVGDIVQDVMLVVVQEIRSFKYDRSKGRFRGWLKTITKNKCREVIRKTRRRSVDGEHPDWLLHVDAEVESMWQSEHDRHVVNQALKIMQAEFEESTWRACLEHVVSGKSAAEVGFALGLTEGAVYTAKSRVLRRLRQELSGLLD